MNVYELISRKRDGKALSTAQLRYLINGFVKGDIPDYQMAAFLMAVYFQGMTDAECVDFTMAIVDSGDQVDLSAIKGFKVDKHSTGGVGDTTTLVLGPLVAASGGVITKMTGRELGHTGGTVDKCEAIPGMRLELTQKQFVAIANRIHISLLAQTARLAPADKLLYALRSVTATVGSIPLIASSIMSKKLAAGSDGIVLDVKTGNGAFMTRYADALNLARTMVRIGHGAGKKVVALITGMAQPLGFAIGNGVEVQEAIDTLKGRGPADLEELVLALGAEMLRLTGEVDSRRAARRLLTQNLNNGQGLAKLSQLIAAQGGDKNVIDQPELLPRAKARVEISSPAVGFVQAINAMEVGLAAKALGAGRHKKEDQLDLSVGIVLRKKIGDPVAVGEPLAVFHTDSDPGRIEAAQAKFIAAYRIGPEPVTAPPQLYARVYQDGIDEFARPAA